MKVVWLAALSDNERQLYWGMLEVWKGGWSWSGLNVEILKEGSVDAFLARKVKGKLSEGEDVLVMGDNIVFKVAEEENVDFVPPYLNPATWLALWEYTHSPTSGLHHYSVQLDMGELKAKVTDAEGRHYTVRLKDFYCNCSDKFLDTRLVVAGGAICSHLLAAFSKLPRTFLYKVIDLLQVECVGEVVHSLLDGWEENGEEEYNGGVVVDVTPPDGGQPSEGAKDTTPHIPPLLVTLEQGGKKILTLTISKSNGEEFTMQLTYDNDTAPFKMKLNTLAFILAKLIGMLSSQSGEVDVATLRNEILTWIAAT